MARSQASSRSLRQSASQNMLNLEGRRKELELQKLDADIRKQNEETEAKRIANEKSELELIMLRNKIQQPN